MQKKPAIVLDVGTLSTKVGFSNIHKNAPDVMFHSQKAVNDDTGDQLDLTVSEDGTIRNWDELEGIVKDAIRTRLGVHGSDYPLLMIEKPHLSPKCRQNMVEFAFEGIGVPAFHLASEPLMALYSVGLSSGIVLSSGHSSSNASTVHEGHRPPYGYVNLGFGGKDVTQFTRELIEAGKGRKVDFSEAEQFKCQYGCLRATSTSSTDKLEILGKEIGEMLLKPNTGCISFQDAITRCIYLTDEEDDYEPVYFRNIMLCGGNTLFTGIKERLEAEIQPPEYLTCGVRVIAPPYRHHAAWIGGSIAASLPTFKTFWITKEDYADHGVNILLRKCLPY